MEVIKLAKLEKDSKNAQSTQKEWSILYELELKLENISNTIMNANDARRKAEDARRKACEDIKNAEEARCKAEAAILKAEEDIRKVHEEVSANEKILQFTNKKIVEYQTFLLSQISLVSATSENTAIATPNVEKLVKEVLPAAHDQEQPLQPQIGNDENFQVVVARKGKKKNKTKQQQVLTN